MAYRVSKPLADTQEVDGPIKDFFDKKRQKKSAKRSRRKTESYDKAAGRRGAKIFGASVLFVADQIRRRLNG